jgi:hypothetical protein
MPSTHDIRAALIRVMTDYSKRGKPIDDLLAYFEHLSRKESP